MEFFIVVYFCKIPMRYQPQSLIMIRYPQSWQVSGFKSVMQKQVSGTRKLYMIKEFMSFLVDLMMHYGGYWLEGLFNQEISSSLFNRYFENPSFFIQESNCYIQNSKLKTSCMKLKLFTFFIWFNTKSGKYFTSHLQLVSQNKSKKCDIICLL